MGIWHNVGANVKRGKGKRIAKKKNCDMTWLGRIILVCTDKHGRLFSGSNGKHERSWLCTSFCRAVCYMLFTITLWPSCMLLLPIARNCDQHIYETVFFNKTQKANSTFSVSFFFIISLQKANGMQKWKLSRYPERNDDRMACGERRLDQSLLRRVEMQ